MTSSASDPRDLSVQVFLDEAIPSDRIEPILRTWLAEADAAAIGQAKFGRISKLARSVNLKAPRAVIDTIRGLPGVIDVLHEDRNDLLIAPIAKRSAVGGIPKVPGRAGKSPIPAATKP